ncbi:MAG: MATE family efflux transporter, partial [Betaproteobacteria bacterium]
MFTKFFNEARQFFRIAIPIYGAQMSYGGIYMTDTIVAGRAGSHELAGVALAASVSSPIFFSLSGIFFGLSPIVAHLNGARKFQSIKMKMRESLWITLAIGLVLMALYGLSPLLLGLTSIDRSITNISASYLGILAFAAIPMMWYTWLRCFSEGLTITKPVFAVAFTAML